MTELQALLDRVKGADGAEPDPDIGHAVIRALLDREARSWWTGNPVLSLDAAWALAEVVAPEWAMAIRQDPRPEFAGLWHALMFNRENTRNQISTWGFTRALAAVEVLLSALIAGRAATEGGEG